MMKKHPLILILLTLFSVGFIPVDANATLTVATFADPSKNSDDPLFTVDFTSMTLDGGWSDAKTGLTLQIPYSGSNFADAWFDVAGVVTLSAPIMPGEPYGTGPGQINFYQNGDSTDPLIIINFNSAVLTMTNFGANELYAENVTITGSEITGTLSQEQFTFSFANLAYLPNSTDWDDGFTATASFTSSAVPEPATVCLLGLGVLSLVGRKKRL